MQGAHGGLTDVARAIGAKCAAQPRIAAAWLFGSVAREEEREDSDLDVAVLLRPGAASDAEPGLRELATQLEPYSPSGRVDILVLGEQGAVLRHRILVEGRLVHEADRDLRVDFEGRTISQYLDWKPTHEIAMQAVFAGLRDRFGAGPR